MQECPGDQPGHPKNTIELRWAQLSGTPVPGCHQSKIQHPKAISFTSVWMVHTLCWGSTWITLIWIFYEDEVAIACEVPYLGQFILTTGKMLWNGSNTATQHNREQKKATWTVQLVDCRYNGCDNFLWLLAQGLYYAMVMIMMVMIFLVQGNRSWSYNPNVAPSWWRGVAFEVVNAPRFQTRLNHSKAAWSKQTWESNLTRRQLTRLWVMLVAW